MMSIDADETPGHKIRDISVLLETLRKEQGLPAVAALVIEGNRVITRGAAGVRKLGNPEPVSIDDRWHLGSCTKAMTATMIGLLVEQGKFSWDTTIAEALPGLAKTMRPQYRKVTVEMLPAHRGGIRHEWDVPGLWEKLWKREDSPAQERRKMAKVMLSQRPKVKPGQYFYSNCGYGIAGHMAETIMKKPWEQLVRELVFKPLAMDSAGFGVPWEGEPPTEPWPHKADGTPVPPGKFSDNPPSIGPGATIHASIGDWAKFVMEHLKGARGKKSSFLKRGTFHRLHKPRKIGKGPNAYGLGWMVLSRPWAKGKNPGDWGRCLQHAGSNNSWFALVWIAPERNFAVLAVTNTGGEGIFPRIDAVIWAVIREHISRLEGVPFTRRESLPPDLP